MIKTYEDMRITLIRSTPEPANLVAMACDITQKRKVYSEFIDGKQRNNMIKFLLKAEHTSLFEHVSYTFYIEGVSRALLAQLTRHRMSSFTCGSQHYQDYRDYDMAVDTGSVEVMKQVLRETIEGYIFAVDMYDVPPEEARMILPNACTVNILWTVNARSLINFLRLRLCKRNVKEMVVFANRIYLLVLDHFPELFERVGTPCRMDGKCNQGRMSCGEQNASK